MKRISLIILSIVFSAIVYCQEYTVPQGYKFENKDSYKIYEPQIKETINWLLGTTPDKEANKRKEASKFFMAWLSGAPDFSVGIDPRIINFVGPNPELLMPFLAGWVKYSLDNDYSKDMILSNKAGIETVVAYYRKNRGYLKKDGNLEKYEKLIEKDKLKEEISKKLKK